jgi:hypothetical protein
MGRRQPSTPSAPLPTGAWGGDGVGHKSGAAQPAGVQLSSKGSSHEECASCVHSLTRPSPPPGHTDDNRAASTAIHRKARNEDWERLMRRESHLQAFLQHGQTHLRVVAHLLVCPWQVLSPATRPFAHHLRRAPSYSLSVHQRGPSPTLPESKHRSTG